MKTQVSLESKVLFKPWLNKNTKTLTETLDKPYTNPKQALKTWWHDKPLGGTSGLRVYNILFTIYKNNYLWYETYCTSCKKMQTNNYNQRQRFVLVHLISFDHIWHKLMNNHHQTSNQQKSATFSNSISKRTLPLQLRAAGAADRLAIPLCGRAFDAS
jgi:hypothetical protein